MSIAKSDGSLGFKELESFKSKSLNLAKQGWRLI